MNLRKTKLCLLYFFLLMALPGSGYTQAVTYDSLYEGMKYKAFDFRNSFEFTEEPIVIKTDSAYKKLLETAQYKVELWIDFDKNTLVCFNYSGTDCHSTFRFKLESDDINKQFVYNVYVTYGGCRAAGSYYDRWSVIPRLPDDYTFVVKKHYVNDR